MPGETDRGQTGSENAQAVGKSFIEVQFPISKLSKECYKERKAGATQTLTGLGKWWGRKPLVLVRAALLGLLMPSSDDPVADREIFLKLMTMNGDALWRRQTKSIPVARLYQFAVRSGPRGGRSPLERSVADWFDASPDKPGKVAWRRGLSRDQKAEVTRRIFERMSYEEKLEFCARPEEIDGPSEGAWGEINAHLGTHAASLTDLVHELGTRMFGHVPRVGDAFCGGGSIPFESARLGCDVYASDLNPVAALLTWGALHIVGGGKDVEVAVKRAREELHARVDRQITEWGIEHNEQGQRADLYLYCYETKCPECGWTIPLSGSWALDEMSDNVVAVLRPDRANRSFDILIQESATPEDIRKAKQAATVTDGEMLCPSPECSTRSPRTRMKLSTLRGDKRTREGPEYGIRPWTREQFTSGPEDFYRERLYCIRWTGPRGRKWQYRAPTEADSRREERVFELLSGRWERWWDEGVLPSVEISPGAKTTPIRRDLGATYWHHLFNPRQLLTLGTIVETLYAVSRGNLVTGASLMLALGYMLNYGSRLCKNRCHPTRDSADRTLYTQAFCTTYNFACRAFPSLASVIGELPASGSALAAEVQVLSEDSRSPRKECAIWITDPPYADAVNYHELCDFFLAWYQGPNRQFFPTWSTDGRHALAVVGKDEQFRRSMADIYVALTRAMPDNGRQIVMFTHSDASVWADLVLIMWSAGLQVTAAWCISTETGSDVAHKDNGNYVQGTVLLVLRKRISGDTAFLDELFPLVEAEVCNQLDQMRALEDARDPNFSDPDYQLAAYAAAMKVLTSYSAIEDVDVARELNRPRGDGEVSPIEQLIRQAVEVATNHLIPEGVEPFTWKQLSSGERYYLKGLDMESRGVAHLSAYQELARGFRFNDYKPLLHQKANEARLRTATELGRKGVGDEGFGQSVVRMALAAIHDSVKREDAREGRNWLRVELPDYWNRRRVLVEVLAFLGRLADVLPHWETDGNMARVLAGAVENDHI